MPDQARQRPRESSQHNTYALDGRVALVTGGTGGLGEAVVQVLLEAGAVAVAVSAQQRPERAAALRQAAGPAANRLSFAVCDMTDEHAVERLVSETVAACGRLDVVMNTVGGYRAGSPVTELDTAIWQQMLDLNLRATFLVAKHAGRVMARQGFGRIVNVSSRAAQSTHSGRRNAAAYAVAKAGAVTLTEVQAEELREAGVTVNVVLPGIIDTLANRQAMPNADTSRWPKPDEVARCMVFLASDDAALISGAAIPVYGRA
jgi:NAD(P)-dependent dehydrogenase (short-subunit alcohol dehydrogenase family)